jgi:hypothetical protein
LTATRADQIKSTWNAQKAIRECIRWTDEHPFDALKTKVAAAIDQLIAVA